jgi:hypothetical protein
MKSSGRGVPQFLEYSISKGKHVVAIRAKITNTGLLIPKDVAERVLGKSSEVEIREEPGRLIVAASTAGDLAVTGTLQAEDPILRLGKAPVRTGTRDGSTDHDRCLYECG